MYSIDSEYPLVRKAGLLWEEFCSLFLHSHNDGHCIMSVLQEKPPAWLLRNVLHSLLSTLQGTPSDCPSKFKSRDREIPPGKSWNSLIRCRSSSVMTPASLGSSDRLSVTLEQGKHRDPSMRRV